MSGDFNAFLIVAAGVAVNASASIARDAKTNKVTAKPAGILIAGAVFGTVCVGVNNATGTKLGSLMAIVFLLSSVLNHGAEFITTVSTLTKG